MAKRQTIETPQIESVQNVVRVDGEGKIHANGGKIDPLCKLRGHADHTWERTTDAVDCQRCTNLVSRREENRKRLEYATRVAESQEPGSQHLHPMEDARPVVPAVEPVKDSEGANITVPVDFDDPSKGRRELDASQGERVLSEDTYTVKTRPVDMRRERARDEFMDAFRSEAPATAEAVQALINKLQRLHNGMTGKPETEGFSVKYHEPKNGPALEGVDIPALPAGVNENTWELAHTGNTESARKWHMERAQEQRKAFLDMQEAMAESRKAVENDTPPF